MMNEREQKLYDRVAALPRTGSSYFGLPNARDDDRYTDEETAQDIFDEVEALQLPTWGASRAEALGFMLGGKQFDVFSVSEERMPGVFGASEALKRLGEIPEYNHILRDKKIRVSLFKHIEAVALSNLSVLRKAGLL